MVAFRKATIMNAEDTLEDCFIELRARQLMLVHYTIWSA